MDVKVINPFPSTCDYGALPLCSTIGFEGKVPHGLHSDPHGNFLVYAIGTNVIKANIVNGSQTFMIGHSNNVTAIDVDPMGRYIASGQMNFMGFKADVIIWDFLSGCKLGTHNCHTTRVNAIAFSCDGKYLMSVGNIDDGTINIYDVECSKMIGGLTAIKGRNGVPRTVTCLNRRNDIWVVGGDDYLSVWFLDPGYGKLRVEKVNLKKIKRDINVIRVDSDDQYAYCGTTTGDVVKVKLNIPDKCFCTPDPIGRVADYPPVISSVVTRRNMCLEKGRNLHLYSGGVTALQILPDGETFVIGTGSGRVVQACIKTICKMGSVFDKFEEFGTQMCVRGKVTSILINCDDILAGTSVNEIYHSSLECMEKSRMLTSAHYSVVNDIAFPHKYSEVFASANFEDVRIWNASAMRELLRINVANITCNAVIFSTDGKTVITGWSDSNIRAYSPQSGTPMWVFHHAHQRGVTALAVSCDSKWVVSGGEEGQVRVWSICPQQMTPIAIMKEHQGPVTGLRMRSDDTEVASSSGDGSIIIWCLRRYVRKALVLQDTLFLDLAWHPCNCQVIGVTHNHKLCYFETFDGTTIREIIASETDPIHSVDVSKCGFYIVTGGADRQVKLWSYKEGRLLRKGCCHSCEVNRVRFSPCGDYILSCCQDGSIFKWGFPKDLATCNMTITPSITLPYMEQCPITDGFGYIPQPPQCT